METEEKLLKDPNYPPFFSITQYRGEGHISVDVRKRYVLIRSFRGIRLNFVRFYSSERTDIILDKGGFYSVSLVVVRNINFINDFYVDIFAGKEGVDVSEQAEVKLVARAWCGQSNAPDVQKYRARETGATSTVEFFEAGTILFLKPSWGDAADMINFSLVGLNLS